MLRLITLQLFTLLSLSYAGEAELSGKLGNYSAYFLENSLVRHHRYELHLKQKAKYGAGLSSSLQIRARFDAALINEDFAAQRDIDEEVREDEMSEAEVRQAYFRYLTNYFRIQIGLQQIDWVESLSPLTNDILTPLDLRHGAFGEQTQVIEPVGAAVLNHKFLFGHLEWLYVPYYKNPRMPKAPNGYGLYPLISARVDNTPFSLTEEEEKEASLKNSEAGIRYLLNPGGFNLSLLAYRGHQKRPVFSTRSINDGRSFAIDMIYPMVNTYGIFSAVSSGPFVFRLFSYYQPNRTPAQVTDDPLFEKPVETRLRYGFGLDLTATKHFKIYTEQFATRSSQDPDPDQGENPTTDYTISTFITNESIPYSTLSLEFVATTPRHSYIYVPQMKFSIFEYYSLTLGARFIESHDVNSSFEVLKDASHAFASLYRYF